MFNFSGLTFLRIFVGQSTRSEASLRCSQLAFSLRLGLRLVVRFVPATVKLACGFLLPFGKIKDGSDHLSLPSMVQCFSGK